MKIKRVSSFQIVQDDGTDVPDDIKEIIDALMEGFRKDRVLGPNSAVPTSALLKMALSVLRRFSVQLLIHKLTPFDEFCQTQTNKRYIPMYRRDNADQQMEEMRINALDDAALDAKRDAMQDEMAK